MSYKWRASYRGRVAAEIAATELERIRRETGSLTARVVVDEARDEASPLHPEFTWDDSKAAEEYRLMQARTMIRAVITVETADAPECNKYVLVQAEGEKGTEYQSVDVVVRDADLFADAVGRLAKEVEEARRALRDLERAATRVGVDAERMARIALAGTALEAAKEAVAQLQ